MSNRVRISAVLLALLLPASAAQAENWPQWRGPRGDGTSSETSVPLTWGDAQGLAWKAAIAAWGTSTPAIWGDAIFLTTQVDDELRVLRLSAADGRTVWSRTVGRAETPRESEKRTEQKFHRLHNNASPSPVTDGEVVVVHFGNGDLAAFDFDGNQLWKRNFQDDYGQYSIWWGHANSPVLHGDLVISVCMQDSLADLPEAPSSPRASYLVAHDKRTGNVAWQTSRTTGAQAEQGDAYTTPVFAELDGATQMIVMGGNQLDAYDPLTGHQLWFLPGLIGGRTITGPVVHGNMVYATLGQRGDIIAVSLGGQGQRPARDVVWRNNDNAPDSCTPVVHNGLLFSVADNGIAICLDAHTGQQKWRERMPGDYKASPVVAEDRVYFLNTAGLCTVISAGARFEKLTENQVSDETLASPAIADGRIYLRGREHLYAVGPK